MEIKYCELQLSDFDMLYDLRTGRKNSHPIKDRYNRIKNGTDSCYVAVFEGRILGDITVTYISKDEYATVRDERAYISGLLIKDGYRNKGIGSALLKYATDEMKRKKYHEATVLVDAENITAKKLYIKNGFILYKEYYLGDTKYELLLYDMR
ncbi:MAG: GNAT family N-acetyltransferase [Clostridia bacterium]|jgi:ribosomal protein S18 acetylase RimI-like enzyme